MPIQILNKKKKYLWTEEKTVNSGANTLTLTNTVLPSDILEIKDKTYQAEWISGIHWNRDNQTITFTETGLPETLTFVVRCFR